MSETIRPRRTIRTPSGIALLILFMLAAILAIALYNATPIGNWGKARSPDWIHITSRSSLVHVGSNDSFATTKEGTQAAKLLLDALENDKPKSAKAASNYYDQLIPVENYGGEYTALQWFCQYILASDEAKQKLLSDRFVANFYNFFAENNYARLKEYLQRKYEIGELADLDTQTGLDRKAVLEDTILFNNPRRDEWENTSKIINALKLKPGQTIADIGSGPGYFSTKFAALVGDKGHVYAIDTVQDHLNYIDNFSKKYGIKNIETVKTEGDTLGLSPKQQVDVAFLCSLYHNIYAMSKTDERNKFVESLNKALKQDGSLFVIDNAMVKESEIPYHGPYIAKELVVAQLKYFGFHLVRESAPVAQRYILEFKKDA
jgi:predicted methyltransferase